MKFEQIGGDTSHLFGWSLNNVIVVVPCNYVLELCKVPVENSDYSQPDWRLWFGGCCFSRTPVPNIFTGITAILSSLINPKMLLGIHKEFTNVIVHMAWCEGDGVRIMYIHM